MKKFVFALVTLFTITVSASAMSYEQARNEALFLTDKMAYELNLTEDQYEAAYEINLDYLLRVNTVDDLYGTYWRYRNLDLSYILFDWQYRAFCDATYFYRPIYWSGGFWHFGIYARYPHRDYFYFGRPTFYVEYRGGHSWEMNGGHSWYRGRRDWGRPDRGPAIGMRDGFRRGDYRNGFDNNRNRTFGNLNNRQFNNNDSRSFGNMNRNNSAGSRSFGNGAGMSDNRNYSGRMQGQNGGTFGSGAKANNNFGESSQNHITRPFGGSRSFGSMPQSSTRTTVTRPQGNNYFGGSTRGMNRGSFERPNTNRSYSAPSQQTPTRSFSAPNRSFGGSRSSGGNFSGGSFGGGSSRSGGSFGGHR
jgi:hypothetical protein